MTSQPKRRWQFGLRDLAWLTLVVALGVGWWVDRQAGLKREASQNARIEELARYGETYFQMSESWRQRAQSYYTQWMIAQDDAE